MATLHLATSDGNSSQNELFNRSSRYNRQMKPKATEGKPKQAAYYIKTSPTENMQVHEATSMLLASDHKFSGHISQLPTHMECWMHTSTQRTMRGK